MFSITYNLRDVLFLDLLNNNVDSSKLLNTIGFVVIILDVLKYFM